MRHIYNRKRYGKDRRSHHNLVSKYTLSPSAGFGCLWEWELYTQPYTHQD